MKNRIRYIVFATPLLFSSCSSISPEKAEANRGVREAQKEEFFDKEDSADQREAERLYAREK